jgi:lysophospholipase L1-like esterase
VLAAVAMTVVLGSVGLIALVTTDDSGSATPSSTTAAGPNHAPVWTAPADRSRFDVVPGRSATFVVSAHDPDRDPVRVLTEFTDARGAKVPRPSYVTCSDADRSPSVRFRCRVAPTKVATAFMDVRVIDDRGASTPSRRYLVSGSPRSYVALGDSYAAGEGVEPFFDPSNRCHRSTRSYAAAVRFPGDGQSVYELSRSRQTAWSMPACSGANTADAVAQLDQPGIGPGTDLVTISVGGNDVGFSEVLTRCGAPPLRDHDCLHDAIDGNPFVAGARARIAALRPKLVQTYQAVLERTFGARLLVVGYPQLFPASHSEQRCLGLRVFDFSTDEQGALRRLDAELDATIRSAAEEVGATYVDMTSVFAGREVCGTAGEWINGVSGTIANWPPIDDASFHPKRAGQAAMAVAINEELRR